MKKTAHTSLFCLAVLFSLTLISVHAEAKCKKMGFLVNDYGKDGPSKDAQELLDKHVAKWATENKIAKYTVGKKEVSCELFLNFVVFDEHTCTASANVCWDEANSGAKGKTTTNSKAQETAKKQSTSTSTETASVQNSPPTEANPTETKGATSEPASTTAKSSEPATASSSASTSNASTEEASKKENVKTNTSDEVQIGSSAKTSSAAPPEEAAKKQNESKTVETCAEKSSSPPVTKVKTSEPAKPKAKPPAPKKPSTSDATADETSEEATNEEDGENPPSDIETGSLPFFSIGKDNQPDFSRNPLNQNF